MNGIYINVAFLSPKSHILPPSIYFASTQGSVRATLKNYEIASLLTWHHTSQKVSPRSPTSFQNDVQSVRCDTQRSSFRKTGDLMKTTVFTVVSAHTASPRKQHVLQKALQQTGSQFQLPGSHPELQNSVPSAPYII